MGTLATASVAGFISYVAGRSMKSHEWRLMLTREKVQVRQRLYAEFLAEVDRLLLLSIQSKISDPAGFHDLIRRFSEIELLATDELTKVAKEITDYAMSSHLIEQKADSQKPIFHSLRSKFILIAKSDLEVAGY